MRHAPLLFLGLLFALALSWSGMIVTPQFQFGAQQPTNVPPANVLYPIPLPGEAQLGREVYQANGCFYCHTQFVRQEGTEFEVVVTNPGTNETAVVQALLNLRRDLKPESAQELLASRPSTILRIEEKPAADLAQKTLSEAGAEASIKVVPVGADVRRGWGTRLTVARDYLYDRPLMLGETRLGPDLTNVGRRQPDPIWHLVHLYDPRLKVPGSTMPKYPFLFEKRPRGRTPRPDALPIEGAFDIVPTREARALAAYLVSLRAELPLFEAPAPQLPAPAQAGATNQPAATDGGTNAVSVEGTNQPLSAPGVTNPPPSTGTNEGAPAAEATNSTPSSTDPVPTSDSSTISTPEGAQNDATADQPNETR